MHITRRQMMMIVNRKPIPLYTRLEYLVSNDSFLNMGVTADETTVIEYSGTFDNEWQDVFFGNSVWYLHNDGWGDVIYRTGSTQSTKSGSTIPKGDHLFRMQQDGLYIDGVKKFDGGGTITDSNYLYLFGRATSLSALTSCSKSQCNEVKIWKQGVLVRHFIPVIDGKGVVCFYDLVTNSFSYAIQGTYTPGKFIAGPVYVEPTYQSTVTYIKNNGLQYIDTGIAPDNSTVVEYYGKWSAVNTSYLMGVRDTNYFALMKASSSTTSNRYRMRVGSTYYLSDTTKATDEPVRLKMTKDALYENDVQIATGTGEDEINGSQNIMLFTFNNRGTPYSPSTVPEFKCYGFKIWKNEKLVRDMIPALNTKGQYCLYDQIEQKCYYDAGGAPLSGYLEPDAPVIPDNITQTDGLETTGTQWINTQIPMFNYNTWRIDLDVEFTSFYNYVALLGTENGTTTHESWVDKNSALYIRYNGVKSSAWTASLGVKYNLIFEYDGATVRVYNGETLLLSTAASLNKLNSILYLFRRDVNYGKLKFYGARIYGNGELLANYIPAYDDSNRGCVYDSVTNKAIYSAGTSDFVVISNTPVEPEEPDVPVEPDEPVQYTAKLDFTFENNKFESIGYKTYEMSASRNLIFEDGCLKLDANSYFQIPVTGEFTRETTIQLVVNELPTTSNLTNWFRFNVSGSTALTFGYMTNEVLIQKPPFVITFICSDTIPRIKTYINNVKITENSPARYLWTRLQIGAGDTSPKPTGLKISRFRIFEEKINESDVEKYVNEILPNIEPDIPDEPDYSDEYSIPVKHGDEAFYYLFNNTSGTYPSTGTHTDSLTFSKSVSELDGGITFLLSETFPDASLPPTSYFNTRYGMTTGSALTLQWTFGNSQDITTESWYMMKFDNVTGYARLYHSNGSGYVDCNNDTTGINWTSFKEACNNFKNGKLTLSYKYGVGYFIWWNDKLIATGTKAGTIGGSVKFYVSYYMAMRSLAIWNSENVWTQSDLENHLLEKTNEVPPIIDGDDTFHDGELEW